MNEYRMITELPVELTIILLNIQIKDMGLQMQNKTIIKL